MKYYCKNCGSEFKPGNEKLTLPPVNNPSVHCPFCGRTNCEFGIIPNYETPEQWEKRTGKPYPDEGIVFVLESDSDAPYWNMYAYGEFYEAAGRAIANEIIVIADPPILPPDNWRPYDCY